MPLFFSRGGENKKMKKKIVVLIFCTLLTTVVLLPTAGSLKAIYKSDPTITRQTKCAFSGEGNNLDNQAVTSSIDLSGVSSIHLEIITLYEILYVGDDDYGYVKVSDNGGSSWTTMKTIQGYTPDWVTMKIDLQNYSGKNILIKFEFTTKSDSISDGWWIQKIVVKGDHEDVYVEDFSEYNVGESWDDWAIIFHIGLPNAPPGIPTITGPTSGETGTDYIYKVTASDPDFDEVLYYVKWGDGQEEKWIGPHQPGAPVSVNHTYTSDGTYTITAQAKDIKGEESRWGSLKVTMPVNQPQSQSQSSINPYLKPLLLRILEKTINNILNRFSSNHCNFY